MKLVAVVVAAAFATMVAAAPGAAQTAAPTAKPKPAAKKAAPKAPAPVAKPVEPPPPEPPPPPPPPPTDVRVKTAYTQGAQISENLTYIHGARQRVEFPGVVSIDQCDLKRTVMLNTAAKRYRVQPYESGGSAPATATTAGMAGSFGAIGGGAPAPARGGVVTITTTLTDTLERQTMFDLEARRVKTLMVKQFGGNTCDKAPLKVEIDAWYVDLPAQEGCERGPAAPPSPPPPPGEASACTDRVEHRVIGDVKLGFPAKIVTTATTGEPGKEETTTTAQEVTELEVTRLNAALFEVPGDFVEAKSSAEIVPALAAGGTLADALFGSTANGTSAAAPKKPGTIRVGVLEPINRTDRTLQANSLRQDLVGKLNRSPYEGLPVAGSSAADIEQDAARLQCDYILLTEIIEIKTSKPGKLGGMMKMASGGGPPQDKHDVKLDYKLYAVGATGTPKLSGSAKASSGGGFGVGSALRLAAFAGQMYMGMGGMGMMGGLGGMMNPMMAMSSLGGLGLGAGGLGAGLTDPRAMAMSSMAMGMAGGMMAGGGGGFGDPSEGEMRETVVEALGNSAKGTMEQLSKKK